MEVLHANLVTAEVLIYDLNDPLLGLRRVGVCPLTNERTKPSNTIWNPSGHAGTGLFHGLARWISSAVGNVPSNRHPRSSM